MNSPTGVTVGLTYVAMLINVLRMPTKYDSFLKEAHHTFVSPDKTIMPTVG